MARIREGWYTVALIPGDAKKEIYIYDNGEYVVIEETLNGNVFEGGFYNLTINPLIVSSQWLDWRPHLSDGYQLRHFKIVEEHCSL